LFVSQLIIEYVRCNGHAVYDTIHFDPLHDGIKLKGKYPVTDFNAF